VKAGDGKEDKSPALLGPAIVLLVLLVGAFFVLRTEGAPKEKVALEPAEAPPAPGPPPAPSVTPPLEYAADGVPFKPHQPSTPDPEGPMHPHPITPEHERIFKENNLFSTISGAMDRRDTVAMRKFLEEYEHEYPEDSHLLQEGFRVIADCIDFPGEKSTAAARAYYGANKASIIRRYVRRHCFEQQPE
jgi:hypothetical protein